MDYTIEHAGATTVTALLEAAGAHADEARAAWLSFPTTRFVVAEQFNDALDVAEGTKVLRTFSEDDCMAAALRQIVDELRQASTCTCTFGHEGGYQLSTMLADICTKKGRPDDCELMRELSAALISQAICDEGKAMGRAVIQALDLFGDEIEGHIKNKTCASGGCRAFQTFHILVSRCIGCGACLEACDEHAILGKPRFVHVVSQKDCVQCGACLEACPENAVVTAGAKKPKTPPKPIPCKR